jgi:protein TonB
MVSVVLLAAGTWVFLACSKDPASATQRAPAIAGQAREADEAEEASGGGSDPTAAVHEAYDTPPVLLHMDPPAYPADAKKAGLEGLVHVRALVGVDGKAREALVGTSSGVPSLDEAALHASRTWRFEPAARSGQAVAVWIDLPIKFALEGKSPK